MTVTLNRQEMKDRLLKLFALMMEDKPTAFNFKCSVCPAQDTNACKSESMDCPRIIIEAMEDSLIFSSTTPEGALEILRQHLSQMKCKEIEQARESRKLDTPLKKTLALLDLQINEVFEIEGINAKFLVNSDGKIMHNYEHKGESRWSITRTRSLSDLLTGKSKIRRVCSI